MKIEKMPTPVTISLSPEEYFLRRVDSLDQCPVGWFGSEYCLTVRIGMSYKAKPDQEGDVFMFLSDEEAQVFRDAGFTELV